MLSDALTLPILSSPQSEEPLAEGSAKVAE